MADEQLRLVASLKDNASAGVRNIGKQLKAVRVEPGMQQAQKWVRGFNDDVAQFKKSGLTVANVMSSMGIGGLAAAGSIGALAAQFKQLADHVLDVKELGREIGVTTDQLRAMERAGQHFGFDPSQMDAALKRLAGFMPILRRGGNNELTQALARAPELIAKIRGEADDTAAVFKDVMGYVGKLQNPQDRIKFYEQIFGDGGLEKLNAEGAGGFEAQVAKARKGLEPMTKEAEAQAQALRDAVIDFNAAVERLELKVAPAVFSGLKQAADDFREAFGVIENAYEWYKANKEHPAEAVGKSFADAVHERRLENEKHPDGIVFDAPAAADRIIEAVVGKKALGRDEFAPAKDDADRAARLAAMQKELDAVAAKIAADKNPVSFAAREADAIARVRELRDAIGTLKRPAQVPSVAPLPPPRPPAPAFRVPSRYDAESRARGADDGKDHSLDGVVVGALEKPILHLSGTLKAAAAAVDGNIHPAAFHPAGLIGTTVGNDPVALLAAGVKQGMLEAMREWAGGAGGVDGAKARDGIIPASFGGGGGGSGGDGNSALGGGSFGGAAGGRTAVSKDLTPESRALLDTLASGEAPDYNVMNGGQRFNNYSHHPGGRAAGRYQFLPSTWARVSRALGLHDFSPESQDKGAWWLAQDDYRRRTGRDLNAELKSKDPARIAAVGRALHSTWVSLGGSFGGKYQRYLDRQSNPAAAGGGEGASVRGLIHGDLKVGGETYRYGSGGAGGSASIPFGDYPINPDAQGPWGRAHGAMAVNGSGTIYDKALGRMRTGIEMHAASTAEMMTHGCLGFLREEYPRLKARVREMIAKTGHAYLHIGPNGASIDASPHAQAVKQAGKELRDGVQDAAAKSTAGASRRLLKWMNKASNLDDPSDTPISTYDMRDPKFAPPGWHDPNRPDLDREKRKKDDADRERDRVEGGVDAHIHLHDGRRISTSTSTRGAVRDARITVRTAPQRTFTA